MRWHNELFFNSFFKFSLEFVLVQGGHRFAFLARVVVAARSWLFSTIFRQIFAKLYYSSSSTSAWFDCDLAWLKGKLRWVGSVEFWFLHSFLDFFRKKNDFHKVLTFELIYFREIKVFDWIWQLCKVFLQNFGKICLQF